MDHLNHFSQAIYTHQYLPKTAQPPNAKVIRKCSNFNQICSTMLYPQKLSIYTPQGLVLDEYQEGIETFQYHEIERGSKFI